jgi:hypothetical protein
MFVFDIFEVLKCHKHVNNTLHRPPIKTHGILIALRGKHNKFTTPLWQYFCTGLKLTFTDAFPLTNFLFAIESVYGKTAGQHSGTLDAIA